eukprot:2552731-Prymnesium_polylepis.1
MSRVPVTAARIVQCAGFRLSLGLRPLLPHTSARLPVSDRRTDLALQDELRTSVQRLCGSSECQRTQGPTFSFTEYTPRRHERVAHDTDHRICGCPE